MEAGVAAVNYAFTPHTWTDGSAAAPATAARLNDIENAVGALDLAYGQNNWADASTPTLTAARFNAIEAGIAGLSIDAFDTFTRVVADGSGWGTANQGGAWTTQTTNTKFGVNGGVARILMNGAPPTSIGQSLPVAHTDANLLVAFSFSTLAVGAAQSIHAELRGTGTASGPVYRFRVDSDPTTAPFATARILELDAAAVATQPVPTVTTTVALSTTGYTWLRCVALGTNLYMRVWPVGTPEGDAWTLTATDATITSGTSIRLRAQTLTGNTSAPTVTFDNLQISTTPGPTIVGSTVDLGAYQQ